MLKKQVYLRIPNFNDALAAKLLSNQYSQLQGDFVEEVKYPWSLWLSLPEKIQSDESFLKAIPWKFGIPEIKTRKIKWSDLLKKIILEEDRSQKITQRIIIKTSNLKVFMHLIFKHFQLQQGQIFFTSPSEKANFYLLKITQPSLWCIHLAENIGQLDIFNESDDVEQLFIKRGWKQRGKITSTTLNIQGNATILLEENTSPQAYTVYWKSANEIIDIKETKLQQLVADDAQRITVPLCLIENERGIPSLWKIKDHKKLIKVISQVHYNQLAGFRAWFDNNGHIFIMSEGRLADSALRSQLTAVFESYCKYESRIFFPRGKSLMPGLPERMLVQVYNSRGDFLCFDEDTNKKLYVWRLKSSELKDLTFFLQYSAQTAIREIDSFQNQWDLNFPDIIPNPIVVIKDSGGKKGIEIREDKSAPSKQKLKKAAKKKMVIKDTRLNYIEKLKEVDSLLVEDIANANLWQQRAQLSYDLGNVMCGVVAHLTSCIISNNHSALLSFLQKNSNARELDIPELFIDDHPKGKILAKIRDCKMYKAELSYVLQLCFAHRFNDEDVRNNALAAMRIGYARTEYKFHIFEDFDKSVEKVVQSSKIEEEELVAIKKKSLEFLSGLSDAKLEQRVVIERQFALVLQNNFGKEVLPLEDADPSSWMEEWQEILQYLQNYHSIETDKVDDTYKIWLEKLSLKDLKNTSFENIFTGDVYRPVFNFDFKEKTTKEVEVIYNDYANGGTGWRDQFSHKYTAFDNAKNQRKLLYLITQYGPLPDFEDCIYDFVFGDIHFNTIIMNCDIYRLHLMYNKKINEREFFDEMLAIFPRPNSGYSLIDFCDGMENVILCLFLSSYQKRDDIFMQIFDKILEWIDFYPSYLTELLTLVAFLQIGIVYHKLPDSVCAYNFYARKKSLWMNHANYISQNGWTT
ncbi:hypothetical protein [Candidatus Uabimicrobium sp. HlEnr_7]|uniref:hypothetical protein n=1 Tax=Candidatus Uabimicrobium helgolandensis TaxID=3095367 RepID=UPI0035591305